MVDFRRSRKPSTPITIQGEGNSDGGLVQVPGSAHKLQTVVGLELDSLEAVSGEKDEGQSQDNPGQPPLIPSMMSCGRWGAPSATDSIPPPQCARRSFQAFLCADRDPSLCLCLLVVDFMILFRESVRVVQFTKKSGSFVCSFSRVSGSSESFSESFRLTSSLRPSFTFANRECQPSRSDSLLSLPPPRSRSRIVNASRVVQTHFLPPPPRSRSRIANASRVGQTHFLPRSQHSNESQNAQCSSHSWVSVRLPRSHFSNESRNHDSQSCNGANGYQSTQH